MYLPSMSAVKWDDNFSNIYLRIISKHGIKMTALIAVERKLLELAHTLFKTQTSNDKSYESKKTSKKNSMSVQKA
jgi:transposase